MLIKKKNIYTIYGLSFQLSYKFYKSYRQILLRLLQYIIDIAVKNIEGFDYRSIIWGWQTGRN